MSVPGIVPVKMMPDRSAEELSILWNTGPPTAVRIDDHAVEVHTNCIIFVSEFYMKLETSAGFRVIQFDKSFFGPVNSILHAGAQLAIFYGQHSVDHIPKITLNEEYAPVFESIWRDMLAESANSSNPISEALLRNSFQRFLLLSERVHMQEEFDVPVDFRDLRIIREFQYLVNTHFMELTRVADYAQILKIPPKKIAQLFGTCYNKKASELIAGRRNLFARRKLIHTDDLIKNIAYELNFSDSQSFSHFFKKQNGISPEAFRSQVRHGAVISS